MNTATRGGRREVPSVALLVADNDSSTRTVTIYDLDDPAMPMWLQFSGNNTLLYSTVNEITALNGRIYLGQNLYGAVIYDFVNDKIGRYRDNVATGGWKLPSSSIADRATTHSGVTGTFSAIVNSTVNDVAATIVEGSEIGALGLPIPTIACATGAGTSVIHANGDVYDVDGGGNYHKNVSWDDDNTLFMQLSSNSTHTNLRVERKLLGQLYADSALANDSFVLNLTNSGWTATGAALGVSQTAFSNAGKNKFAQGGPSGLHLWKRAVGFDALNNAEPPNLNAYITSTYNTGYMLGDIRFAGLARSKSEDRSVKGNTLTKSGTINGALVATGAEVYGYSNFSASNYLSRAYDADFDFADGKVSVMCWVKVVAGSTYQAIANRYGSGDTVKGWFLYLDPNEKAYFEVVGASTVSSGFTSILADGWHFICGVSDGSKVKIYADGVLANSATLAAGDLSNSSAKLQVGIGWDETNYPVLGSLSLLRISATAPTPTQVKEIYEAEAPLFRAGAKCLLQSDSGVSPNGVEDLAFDDSTGLLHVAQRGNTVAESRFRGLEMVESVGHKSGVGSWDYSDISFVAANAGVVASARTLGDNRGVITDIPPFDVRGDTNIADSKLPNDGKIRFTGVTASTATPTVIGHIPLALGDKITVKARVQGHIYQYGSLNGYYEEITATFQRPYDTGTVAVHTSFSNPTHSLSDTTLAGLDVELNANDTAKTCEVKVTGSASYRMQWNATVEVQRISEKQYER